MGKRYKRVCQEGGFLLLSDGQERGIHIICDNRSVMRTRKRRHKIDGSYESLRIQRQMQSSDVGRRGPLRATGGRGWVVGPGCMSQDPVCSSQWSEG